MQRKPSTYGDFSFEMRRPGQEDFTRTARWWADPDAAAQAAAEWMLVSFHNGEIVEVRLCNVDTKKIPKPEPAVLGFRGLVETVRNI